MVSRNHQIAARKYARKNNVPYVVALKTIDRSKSNPSESSALVPFTHPMWAGAYVSYGGVLLANDNPPFSTVVLDQKVAHAAIISPAGANRDLRAGLCRMFAGQLDHHGWVSFAPAVAESIVPVKQRAAGYLEALKVAAEIARQRYDSLLTTPGNFASITPHLVILPELAEVLTSATETIKKDICTQIQLLAGLGGACRIHLLLDVDTLDYFPGQTSVQVQYLRLDEQQSAFLNVRNDEGEKPLKKLVVPVGDETLEDPLITPAMPCLTHTQPLLTYDFSRDSVPEYATDDPQTVIIPTITGYVTHSFTPSSLKPHLVVSRANDPHQNLLIDLYKQLDVQGWTVVAPNSERYIMDDECADADNPKQAYVRARVTAAAVALEGLLQLIDRRQNEMTPQATLFELVPLSEQEAQQYLDEEHLKLWESAKSNLTEALRRGAEVNVFLCLSIPTNNFPVDYPNATAYLLELPEQAADYFMDAARAVWKGIIKFEDLPQKTQEVVQVISERAGRELHSLHVRQ